MSELITTNNDNELEVGAQTLLRVQQMEAICTFSHALGIENTPMWVGFNSRFSEEVSIVRQKIC